MDCKINVSESMIYDDSISFKAKGVLCGLLSLEDENINIYDLKHKIGCKESLDSLNSAMKELINNDYVERVKSTGGYVYLITDGYDNYKIGISSELENRMKSYETHVPFLEVIGYKHSDNYKVIEQTLHKKYSDKHIKGEWFKLSESDVEYIYDKFLT